MALFMDGFDYYNTMNADQGSSIWDSGSAVGSFSAVGSGVYAYGRSVQVSSATLSKTFANVENTPGANWQTIYLGFHHIPNLILGDDSVRPCQFIDNVTNQLNLRVTATGVWKLYRDNTLLATGTNGMAIGQPYWISIKAVIASVGGSFKLHMSGPGVNNLEIDYSGDTANTANDYATRVVISRASGNASGQQTIDNFHLFDGSDGAPYNDLLTERRIYFGLADGDGSDIAWTASAGSRYQCVDENPPNGDTDYISTAGVGNRNSVTIPDFSAISPDAVKMSCQVRRDDAGPSNIALFVKDSGGTYSTGPDYATGAAYVYAPRTMILSPFTAGNWGLAEINGAEWGVQRTS